MEKYHVFISSPYYEYPPKLRIKLTDKILRSKKGATFVQNNKTHMRCYHQSEFIPEIKIFEILESNCFFSYLCAEIQKRMNSVVLYIVFLSLLIEAAIWAQGAWMLTYVFINCACMHNTVLPEGPHQTAVANEDVRCCCCRILRDDNRVRIRSPDEGEG